MEGGQKCGEGMKKKGFTNVETVCCCCWCCHSQKRRGKTGRRRSKGKTQLTSLTSNAFCRENNKQQQLKCCGSFCMFRVCFEGKI